jgi:hypothetical protein
LKEAIETDAKFVLKLPEFQAFMDKLPRHRTSQQSQQVSEWSLNHDDQILQVSQYKPVFEPDDYDDEQNHASYGYFVAVRWGAKTVKMNHIVTRRVYGAALSRCVANKLNNWLEPSLREGLNHFFLPLDKDIGTKICRKLTRFVGDPNNFLKKIIGC